MSKILSCVLMVLSIVPMSLMAGDPVATANKPVPIVTATANPLKPVAKAKKPELAATTQQPNYLDEIARMEAQLSYLQKQQELSAAESKLGSGNANEGLPRLISIIVDDKGGAAQILYDSGFVRWVKEGDLLPDGFKVLSIQKSTMQVGGNGGKFYLGFAEKNEVRRATYIAPFTGSSSSSAQSTNVPQPQIMSSVNNDDERRMNLIKTMPLNSRSQRLRLEALTNSSADTNTIMSMPLNGPADRARFGAVTGLPQ